MTKGFNVQIHTEMWTSIYCYSTHILVVGSVEVVVYPVDEGRHTSVDPGVLRISAVLAVGDNADEVERVIPTQHERASRVTLYVQNKPFNQPDTCRKENFLLLKSQN